MKTNLFTAGLAAHARTITTTGHLIIGRTWLWTGFLAFATIAFGPQPAQAAVTEAWVQHYGGDGWDSASAMAVDSRGNVVVTGYSEGETSGYATIVYSGAGVPLWTNRYNDALGNGWNNAVAVDGSGNVVVTGSSVGSEGSSDYATIAYSGAGVPLWTNRYNGPENGWARGTAVAVNASGNVFVTGYSTGNGGNSDYLTIAYSSAGAPLWTNRYNGPGNGLDVATAMAVDGNGNVVVTGSSNDDYYTAKYAAADGALLWEKRYNGPADSYDIATAVAVDASGNVVVTGHSGGLQEWDFYTAKYAAADGTLVWEKHYNGPANLADSASAVAVDASGNVVVTGHVDGPLGFLGSPAGDYYTAKYAAADGTTLWEKRFNRTLANQSSPRLALGPNGMIVVSGTSSYDYATVIYREVPEVVSINLISTGVRVRFSGLSGRSYNIERAPAVTGPWSTINTQTAPPSGAFEYLDTNPPAAAAFYRASEP